MLFRRVFTNETSESRDKIEEILQQVIETKDYEKPKSFYKGEFVKEGFLILPKWSASASGPSVWIAGKYSETMHGTKIEIRIELYRIIKLVFCLINAILAFGFLTELNKPEGKWRLVIGFFIFLWFFSLGQFWAEVRSFKSTIIPLFEESKKEKM